MVRAEGFDQAVGWSAIDTNRCLDTPEGRRFLAFLRNGKVELVIRYYAAAAGGKALTPWEARLLSQSGFHLLPIYQDNHRTAADFGARNGRRHAINARRCAHGVGQPEGSTILFAVDRDFAEDTIREAVVPYFEAIRSEIGDQFRIGAYGTGLVLRILLENRLIAVPWLSMAAVGRESGEFFLSGGWALRQVPPELEHHPSGVGYDRNILNGSLDALGAFKVREENEAGHMDAVRIIPNRRVRCDGLYLRSEPEGDILRALTIGEPVTDLGPTGVEGWREVDVGGKRGCVFGRYLRRQQGPEIERLVGKAVAEWLMFDRGQAKEDIDPYNEFVAEMWRSIGLTYSGNSHYDNGDEVPWSAAFISFVVGQSGETYRAFRFAPRHSIFVHDAIQARILKRLDRPFWGYRRTERRPAIGDIIHCNRGDGHFSFDFAEVHSRFDSHSDIVVEITDYVARVIGGNVTDSVSMQEYKLDSDGFLADNQGVITLLKNRANQVS